MKRPDWIYLQWEGDGEGDVTWCVDKINDDDIKYLCDGAAEARIAELEDALYELECSYDETADDDCHWCGCALFNPYTQTIDHEQHAKDCRWKNKAWTILRNAGGMGDDANI